MTYATSSPAATTGGPGNIPPVCQNCQTSTTPLWRRDEIGSVLCNACGLFLKLHGRPRPISLKTDVIKSRNRVKTAGQGPKKKSLFDANGLAIARSEAGTPPLIHHPQHRRQSQKTSSGASDRSTSPISRIDTPSVQGHNPNIAPQHMFDNAGLSALDHGLHPSPSLPALHLSHPSPGSASSLADRHLEPPHTYEGLMAQNTSLKTRVSELEVINDLFKGRVGELEQSDSNARRSEIMIRESEGRLRRSLEESYRREDELKRKVDHLEAMLKERERALEEDGGHKAKKMRMADMIQDSENS